MKAKVPVDDQLIAQTMTAEAAVEMALRELIHGNRPKDLMELAGRIEFRADFDHKDLRDLRRDAG